MSLRKINSTFPRAVKHKAVGKRVMVINGHLKGYTGYVFDHNYVLGTYTVDLVGARTLNIKAVDLVYQ